MKLIKIGSDNYRIDLGNSQVEGNFKCVIKVLLDLDYAHAEIEAAFTDMISKNNSIANFGVLKTFIFSN